MLNNPGCDYDGGDCCGSNVNTDYCEQCQCLEWEGGCWIQKNHQEDEKNKDALTLHMNYYATIL